MIAQHPGGGGQALDADDAMRLTQVRDFLAGHGWFDLHEPRMGLASGYDSHWSRLIDAGLAGFYLFFRMFTDQVAAERLMGAHGRCCGWCQP